MVEALSENTFFFSREKEANALQKKLLWLMGVRLALGTLLMGATLLFQISNKDASVEKTGDFVFWLLGFIFVATLFYSVLFPRIQNIVRFATFQLLVDVIIISLLILTTGCQDSLFLFCYLLVIIGAANLLYRSGAFLFASISLLFLCLILFLNISGFLEVSAKSPTFAALLTVMKSPPKMSSIEFLYIVVIYGCAFYLVAFLSSQLIEQVRYTGEIIQQQQVDIDNLEALHYDIVTSLPSGLLTTDSKGKIRSFNQSAKEILGHEWKDVYGKKITELFPALGDRPLLRSDSQTLNTELPVTTAEGKKRVLVLSSSPLRDRHHRQIGTLILLQDVSDIKEMENIARRNEKLASLGQLAGGLAHEIRNPLAALSGCIQLLQSEVPANSENESLMNIVVKETDRLNSLLNDFLLFARPREPQKQDFQLSHVLTETIFLLKQDPLFEHVSVIEDVEEDVRIYADASLLRQILLNLLMNGAQAMSGKGEIEVKGQEAGDGTWIYITDDGPGMDEEVKQSIFNPFFSTKDQGTGLGLAVLQRVVAQHFGETELDTQPGGPTQFRLFFPKKDVSGDVEQVEKIL